MQSFAVGFGGRGGRATAANTSIPATSCARLASGISIGEAAIIFAVRTHQPGGYDVQIQRY
jgi:hypothetical protein